mgnify:CR=1 FL=1
MDQEIEWKLPEGIPKYKLVVPGDVVWFADHMTDKLYTLFGMSREEVKQYFDKHWDMCVNMVMGKHPDNAFAAKFKEVTHPLGSSVIEQAKVEAGCAGLSNPGMFNLNLPDQFMVTEVNGNKFKITFFKQQLKQRWASQPNSDLVRSFIDGLELEMGSNDYFKMGAAY